MITYEESIVGYHLTDVANQFGAIKIEHIGGNKFEAINADGKVLRMLTDEGIGSTEYEDGMEEEFEERWKD